jgi:hypothetical protein
LNFLAIKNDIENLLRDRLRSVLIDSTEAHSSLVNMADLRSDPNGAVPHP